MPSEGIPKFGVGKFAVMHARFDTGQILNLDGTMHTEDEDIRNVFMVFDSLEKAIHYAQEKVKSGNNVEVVIYDGGAEFLEEFRPDELRE